MLQPISAKKVDMAGTCSSHEYMQEKTSPGINDVDSTQEKKKRHVTWRDCERGVDRKDLASASSAGLPKCLPAEEDYYALAGAKMIK